MPLVSYRPELHNLPDSFHGTRAAPLVLGDTAEQIIMPGTSNIPLHLWKEWWDMEAIVSKKKCHPMRDRLQEMINLGALTVSQEQEEIPSLSAMTYAKALETIRDTVDLELLRHWKQTEPVPAFQSAIAVQIQLMTPTDEERAQLSDDLQQPTVSTSQRAEAMNPSMASAPSSPRAQRLQEMQEAPAEEEVPDKVEDPAEDAEDPAEDAEANSQKRRKPRRP